MLKRLIQQARRHRLHYVTNGNVGLVEHRNCWKYHTSIEDIDFIEFIVFGSKKALERRYKEICKKGQIGSLYAIEVGGKKYVLDEDGK